MKQIKKYLPGSVLLLATLFSAAPALAVAPVVITCAEYHKEDAPWQRNGTNCTTVTGEIEAVLDMENGRWILTATPTDSSWMFVKWSDGVTDQTRYLSATDLDAVGTYTAEFAAWYYGDCYALEEYTMDETKAVNDTGKIVVSRGVDDSYILQAVAEEGYTFAQWADGSYVNPRTFEPSAADKDTIFATFIPTNKLGKIDFWRKDGIVVTTTEDEGELDDIDQFSNITVFYNGNAMSCGHPNNEDDIDIEPRVDVGVYYLPASYGADLSLAGKNCHIVFKNEEEKPFATLDTVIPYLIDNEVELTVTNPEVGVHVLNGGVATFATDQEIADLDIYPGGKAVVSADLTVSSITMRADALTPYNEGIPEPHEAWQYPFMYPELLVTGSISNGNNDTIYYDFVTDYFADAWFPFAVPYPSNTSKARYRSGEDATDNFLIDQYSTSLRASGGSGWTPYYDSESGYAGGVINPGKGYDIYAIFSPRNEDGTYGAVLRFPMFADLTSGVGNKQISVEQAGTDKAFMNWNLISIPYLSAYRYGTIGMYNGDTYIDKNVRYVTFPDLNWTDYSNEEVSTAVLYPFHPYFVQFEDDIDNLRLTAPTSIAAAPKKRQAKTAADTELSAGITLAQIGRQNDHIGLHIGENYTTGYDVNADLAKVLGKGSRIKLYSLSESKKLAYIALPIANGSGILETIIPLGYDSASVGQEMTFAYDELRYPGLRENENIIELNLIDNVEGVEVNLLETPYTCTAYEAADNTRFSLGVRYTKRAPQIATDICDIDAEVSTLNDGVYDLLGRRISAGSRTLRTGVYIIIENGQARKEVIR